MDSKEPICENCRFGLSTTDGNAIQCSLDKIQRNFKSLCPFDDLRRDFKFKKDVPEEKKSCGEATGEATDDSIQPPVYKARVARAVNISWLEGDEYDTEIEISGQYLLELGERACITQIQSVERLSHGCYIATPTKIYKVEGAEINRLWKDISGRQEK